LRLVHECADRDASPEKARIKTHIRGVQDHRWINVLVVPAKLPMMHHVVFAVGQERLASATAFLEALGFHFQTHELDDIGLLVTLDWERGVELVTPTAGSTVNPGSVADFLARQGDGVYSVVVRVDDVDAASQIAERYGAAVEFRQDRGGNGLELVEVQLAAMFGMSLTFLSTNLP
jgi:4-hydroxyphenylpyruvate dioxygenase-like putative hemolysin